ncbi:MAG: aspartate-semialdehyde dehydrogenase [Chloroflexi bacterium]|nr:aspartate-semialdehyde dehydrogenase [Chloroflexota bacterium]
MGRNLNVGILGASGLVGRTFLRLLEERHFPVGELRALASERSEGQAVPFRGTPIPIRAARPDMFDGIHLAFFCVDEEISRQWAPIAGRAGAVVIDAGAAWRMDTGVPLVVPEVNPDDAGEHEGIIAGPNCSTIQMVVALAPIHRVNPITRIIVDSYQSVSGAGIAALEELDAQTRAYRASRSDAGVHDDASYTVDPSLVRVHPHQIAMNVLPQIGSFRDNGYSGEEMKIVNETRKIMHAPDIAISATTVRVPVAVGHAEAVHVELTYPMSAEDVRGILVSAAGVAIVDDPSNCAYPLPIHAAGRDEVFVGRIRKDLSHPHGIAMWIVSDNVRKGAALNAVQVAELLIQDGCL